MVKTSKTLSRRTLLIGAGAAAAVGGAGYVASRLVGGENPFGFGPNRKHATSGEPEVLRSKNGKLTVDLVVAETLVEIDGVKVRTKTYNGSLPGPTLMAKPGDLITVNFKNELAESTNLHAHGLHVSPEGNSDNVMIEVHPGETFTYEYQLDASHPSGISWYHPHLHGAAANQIFAGLYGAIVVEDAEPVVANRERMLVFSDIDFDDNGNLAEPGPMALLMGREGKRILLNGQSQPDLEFDSGAVEHWRIVNACSSRFLHLHWSAGKAELIAMDGYRFEVAESVEELVLAPGNRGELVMRLGSSKFDLTFDSVAHPDSMSAPTVGYRLATFKPSGKTVEPASGLASGVLISARDIRSESVAAKRKFTLAMPSMASLMNGDDSGSGNMGGMNGMNHGSHGAGALSGFTINGESFDMNKVNTRVELGTFEEWEIVNTSNMNHPFHLHVWPMQILSINGEEVQEPKWQDVISVPYLGKIKVRIAFENFGGKTMYHCHILDHEDLGMMGVIEAV